MNSICRLCLGEKVHLLNVFESKGISQWTAAEAIMELLRLQVTSGDKYPKSVCVECLRKLEEFKLFKQQCKRNKDLLDRAYAGSHAAETNEGDTETGLCHNENQSEVYVEEEDDDILIDKDPLEMEETGDQIKMESGDCCIDVNKTSISGTRESEDNVSHTWKNEHGRDVIKEVNSCRGNTFVESDGILKEEVVDIPAEEECDGFFNERLSPVPANELTTSMANDVSPIQRIQKGSSYSTDNVLENCTPGQYTDKSAGSTDVAFLPNMECNDVNTEKNTESNIVSSNVEVGSLSCNICMERFAQIEDLEVHMNYHGEKKKFKCETCKIGFHLEDSLKRHECGVRVKPTNGSYMCNWCGKQFPSLSKRNRHVFVHVGVKPFNCRQCGKNYTNKRDLRGHMLFHFGKRPFKCNLCSRAFIYKSFLTSHMRSHSGEKPFNCTLCDKSFSQAGSLKRHMMLHTGERPYGCNQCGKSFIRRVYLKEHLMRHSGIRPYKCTRCSMAFVTKHCLDKHFNVRHS